MQSQKFGLSLVVMGLLLACPMGMATAQDEPPPPQVGPPGPPERGSRMQNPEFRQRMLDEFDKDGNGELDESERQAMREQMRERREQMRERFGRGPDGPPPRGDRAGGPDERRGRGGPPGPGHDGPLPLEGLFEWFDGNRDNQLSRDEFRDLAQFVHHRRHHGPPQDGPEGRGFGRRGPDGPPPGEGFGRGGPRGRGWGDGPGRRGPDVKPPRADDGAPPLKDTMPLPPESSTPQPTEAAADEGA